MLTKMEHLENRIRELEIIIEKMRFNITDDADSKYTISMGNKNCVDSVQGESGISIGDHAGFCSKLGMNTVNIGNRAGYNTSQGAHSIAIGHLAGTGFHKGQSICLNASGEPMSTPEFDGHVSSGGFYVKPLRQVSFDEYESMLVYYNPRTGEFTYLKTD